MRACVLATLMPATEDLEKDLEIFERLMAIDDASFAQRAKKRADVEGLLALSYEDRVDACYRPEETVIEIDEDGWAEINRHLNTSADSIEGLVRQLGEMRFGRTPVVADTFSGGGSIPFEASRIGCDVFASDLNPIACMLTWGAFNVVGGSSEARDGFDREQEEAAAAVRAEIDRLGIERDEEGNTAKAFLYCCETRCPESEWMVPMMTTRVISKAYGTIVDLVPDAATRTYGFDVRTGVSAEELEAASKGTVRGDRLVHPMNSNEECVSISSIRGDTRTEQKGTTNRLRPWRVDEFEPAPGDIWQDRLYAILWMRPTAGKRKEMFFRTPTPADLEREAIVSRTVASNLSGWQASGLVPDMAIEAGDETSRILRERGWTHWHHLFNPRQLLFFATLKKAFGRSAVGAINVARLLDRSAKNNKWSNSNGSSGQPTNVFDNQALNLFFNYGTYASYNLLELLLDTKHFERSSTVELVNAPSNMISKTCDMFITDPPYADAVNYHEITEFFIAWLRNSPPEEFSDWKWDSRRRLAIKGKGEDFRASMVDAYKAMTERMPDNGVQIVMFTHQDGKVWSDMAQIFWGAGLQVMADWYIATETSSEMKKGGYVQGTHTIVLRKRPADLAGYADEITLEVREEVARQIEDMVGLNQTLKGKGRNENLFNDADLQMAGYAAALRVLTKYATIDDRDMTVEATRPRAKNERTVIDDIITYSVQVANEHLVPEGMDEPTWRKLTGAERFYLKMLDIESTGARKVDNYQNFGLAFRVRDRGALMASEKANDASLKTAKDFGKRQLGDDEFGGTPTRAVLYALWEMGEGVDDDLVLEHLKGLVDDYLARRPILQTIARYIAMKRSGTDRTEATNAQVLADLIKNQRLG